MRKWFSVNQTSIELFTFVSSLGTSRRQMVRSNKSLIVGETERFPKVVLFNEGVSSSVDQFQKALQSKVLKQSFRFGRQNLVNLINTATYTIVGKPNFSIASI